MQPLLEMVASRKLGVAVVAMVLISQLGADASPYAVWLIALIAMMHIMCQTWLDARAGATSATGIPATEVTPPAEPLIVPPADTGGLTA